MTDPSKNKTFAASNALLKQALATIPTGSQTFSKSHIQFPDGHAPLFVDRAQGAHFTDIDGNVFTDLAMGLAAVGLGYCDPDVDAAIREQLACGISFSLPTRLEAELAELIVDVVPSAEMVRFAKNGSDVTSAAVRLARAYTGRERVLACGYHGWHDWYIGTTTRDLGVPGSVRVLTDRASANDPETVATKLAEHPDGFAAIIVEPMLPQHAWMTLYSLDDPDRVFVSAATGAGLEDLHARLRSIASAGAGEQVDGEFSARPRHVPPCRESET